jgi:hypothetical protein
MSRFSAAFTIAVVVGIGVTGAAVSLEAGEASARRKTRVPPLVQRSIPDEDPGPPFYARVGMQFFDNGKWLAIPFYRPPECVPPDFNLLEFFHFPGPAGPGAFACPVLMSGRLLIEADAPLGTFPRKVWLQGGNVPVWFVASDLFAAAAADGQLTIGELESLQPLKGVASYHEMLQPRDEDHLIIIVSHGKLEDGRAFWFHVTQVLDEIKSLRIAFSRPRR